jgi:CRP-like cAMP-binding protein
VNAAVLKGFSAFADLSDAEREEVCDLLESRGLAPGETLFAEGDDADSLVLVTAGALELSSRRTGASWVAGSGSVIGALSLFAVGLREAKAVGAERTQVRLLSRAEFLRLAEDSPRTACRIATAIAAELAAQTRLALDALGADAVDLARPGE